MIKVLWQHRQHR